MRPRRRSDCCRRGESRSVCASRRCSRSPSRSPLAWLLLHLGLDVEGDKDASVVFRWQGNTLLRGEYPRSEYPVGAVLLFAFEAWLGGGSTRTTNALAMLPFQAALVGAIWATRMRFAPWLAAFVGLWPANAFFWELKYDLAPAALLAVGLVLALRERWAWSGVALAAGGLVKWTPVLAVAVLAVWLLAQRRVRDALVHAGAAVAVAALVYVPFLLWRPDEVAAAYERQSGRAITPESVWYLLLRPFDLAHVRTHISFSAGAPDWANVVAGTAQVALVLLVLVAAAFVRGTRARRSCSRRSRRRRSCSRTGSSARSSCSCSSLRGASPPRWSCARGASSSRSRSRWARPRSRTRSSIPSPCRPTTTPGPSARPWRSAQTSL